MVRGPLLVAVCVALVGAPSAAASPRLQLGITDSGGALYGDASLYSTLGELHASVLRVHLNWGGRAGVARRMPVDPSDPSDRAYDWSPYDRIVLAAAANGVEVLFSIFGTPPWANGGAPPNRAPRDTSALEDFAYAAATRYSGYLTQAVAIARRDPRIDLLLWFLLQDERGVERWQSGLVTVAGKRKPAFDAFRRAARSLAQ